jgi:hypothetical protein
MEYLANPVFDSRSFLQTQVGFSDVPLCQVDSPVELRMRLADVLQTTGSGKRPDTLAIAQGLSAEARNPEIRGIQ